MTGHGRGEQTCRIGSTFTSRTERKTSRTRRPRNHHGKRTPFSSVPSYKPFKDPLEGPCGEAHPRVFHMFWARPVTAKPYSALFSFLLCIQTLDLHLPPNQPNPKVFLPRFWLWINPGPVAFVPNPNALRDMFESSKASPWASQFSHLRFKDVIQFQVGTPPSSRMAYPS